VAKAEPVGALGEPPASISCSTGVSRDAAEAPDIDASSPTVKPRPSDAAATVLAATGESLSHERLDELPPGRNEYYIRQLLVTTGVLPERHDDLERLPAWTRPCPTSPPSTPS
jgi:hypothetical protein